MEEGTKACPLCGETIKAAAIKCRFCNSDLTVHAATGEAEVEKDLFVGHPAMIYKATQWLWVPLFLVAAFLAAKAGLDVPLAAAGAVVGLGIVYLVYWWRSISRTYRITTQRIKRELGVLGKRQDSLELFRIDHFELFKPVSMRLMGYCKLRLFTSDAELEDFALWGIPELESLAETLRECQLRERTRRGLTTFVKA
jgi:uncharacterized membrane protein YdbT with pleckstrin-like domain